MSVILNELIITYISVIKIQVKINDSYTIPCQEESRHRRPLNEFIRSLSKIKNSTGMK